VTTVGEAVRETVREAVRDTGRETHLRVVLRPVGEAPVDAVEEGARRDHGGGGRLRPHQLSEQRGEGVRDGPAAPHHAESESE
jgi:hypothetical protein